MKTISYFITFLNIFNASLLRGWIKEVGGRAELRGTLVRAIAIDISMNIVRA